MATTFVKSYLLRGKKGLLTPLRMRCIIRFIRTFVTAIGKGVLTT